LKGDVFIRKNKEEFTNNQWIPELTVTEEINGTIYTVTGSYHGEESFLRKLERITTKKFTEKLETRQ